MCDNEYFAYYTDMEKEKVALSEKPGMHALNASEKILAGVSLSKIDKNHWKIAFFVVLGLLVLTVLTIKEMLPLKTLSVYRVEVDNAGTQHVQKMSTTAYEPSENEVRSRLKEMVERMFAIEARLLSINLTKVEAMMSGQARAQFSEFLKSEKIFARIQERQDLLREVSVAGVNSIAPKVFLIDFTTKERLGSAPPVLKRKTMTVNYEIVPPKTDEEVLGDNPAGIYIVSFTISDKVNDHVK